MNSDIADFKNTPFSDLIDVVFALDLIYEDTFENLHKFRLFRNNYAHKFLYNLGVKLPQLAENISNGTVLIEELSDILEKLQTKRVEFDGKKEKN